jgi:DNA helicase-2/ATP-dependent DNA helicase PcrA
VYRLPTGPVGVNITPQQEAVVEFFRSGTGDLCVTARAGAGKSSTILLGVLARPPATSATLCAFNRRISEDLADKLQAANAGSYVRAKTLHGVGYRAISRAVARGRRLVVNRDREFEIALALMGGGDDTEDEARLVGRLAALGKETSPDDLSMATLRDLALDFGLADSDDEDDDTYQVAIARAKVAVDVIERSLDIRAGEISYADMLWLPIARSWSPDQTDLVCVDEAQDMGLAQLRLAARVRRAGGRIVVVGDPRQAIYSWRGAAPGALDLVADRLAATRLSLTVSFRCAAAVVAEARKIVPDIEHAPGAQDGIVRSSTEAEMIVAARPGDFVLSRTNGALASVCLSLIRSGIPARIVGSDVGTGLIRLVRRLARGGGSSGDEVADLLTRLNAWREREVRRAVAVRRPERAELVSDQAALVVALSVDVTSVAAIIETIEDVFADDGRPRVMCSTIHRAKGLEADRVWILAQTLDSVTGRTALQELEEANLRYVAITRARRELVWVQ